MKKMFVFSLMCFVFANLFSFDRDYSKKLEQVEKASGEKFLFRDVFGNEFKTVIRSDVPKTVLNKECFKLDGIKMTLKNNADDGLENSTYELRRGVDISHHDGEVNFKKLKKQGYDFVILRCGFRGYQSGTVNPDRNFHKNIKAAIAAGFDVGIYFFSQADSEKEALEEAAFVLEQIRDYKITLPVFYDPEIIRDDEARSDHITGEQFSKNAVVFCEKLKEAGYVPGVYSNMLWEAYEFNMTDISNYVIWYADYEEQPQTPYRFEFWQYAEKDGDIHAPYDMDVMLIKK